MIRRQSYADGEAMIEPYHVPNPRRVTCFRSFDRFEKVDKFLFNRFRILTLTATRDELFIYEIPAVCLNVFFRVRQDGKK